MPDIHKKLGKKAKTGVKAIIMPKHTAREVRRRLVTHKINKGRRQSYADWFRTHSPTIEELEFQGKEAAQLEQKPLISVLIPIYNTPEKYLRECIQSVIDQTYTNWELCIADDASTTPILEVVEEYSKVHKNIRWVRLSENRHIAASSNAALSLAKGQFVALLDHDDILLPNALYESVKAINDNPEADLIYSDEDKVEKGKGHLEPFFKPDWSPDFLKSCNYITHFAVIRKSKVDEIKGFRDGTEGAQDWDLFLRLTKITSNVVHIPKVLYSWRKSPTSTAKSSGSKPYAYINQRSVLRHALSDSPLTASVAAHPSLGFWRVRYQIKDNPKVSIIIPTKNSYELINNCLLSIFDRTSYANFEVIIVDTGSTDPSVAKLYESKLITTNEVHIVRWKDKKFNFSSACNTGAENATGEYLLFLNNDTEVISSGWIESMLEHAQREEVGMVGAELLFPDETIQHAGVVLSERDIAFHPFYGLNPKLDIFTNIYIANIRNTAAVTAACSMVNRNKFNKAGGFNEKLRVTYNDVDLCLKLLDSGLYNVYTPNAKLYHYESKSIGKITSSGRDKKELEEASAIMRKRWSKYLRRDPYYNDNFEQHGPGYRLP